MLVAYLFLRAIHFLLRSFILNEGINVEWGNAIAAHEDVLIGCHCKQYHLLHFYSIQNVKRESTTTFNLKNMQNIRKSSFF